VFRRTKIVATLGPASSDAATIRRLIEAGVNVFRMNMSHGTQAEHRARYQAIRDAQRSAQRELAVLADLSGPKIRVGTFESGSIQLVDGQLVTVTTRQVVGHDGLICSQYLALANDVQPGHRLLLDDGNLELCVQAVDGTEIECRVVHGGTLKDKKGMNLPGVPVSAPALTEKDRADALFACELGVDFIALSFVRKAGDVSELRQLVAGAACPPWLVAKIEKPEALEQIPEILAVSDAIMVARGDLGVELDAARVPNVQEQLVDLARTWKKPVIIATQMLESMITQSRPTRAEVTDIANAVRSGADAVMLSAETAAGAHPIEAVNAMDLVIRRTEDYQYLHGAFAGIEAYTPMAASSNAFPVDVANDADTAVAQAAARMSRDLRTSAIVADASAQRLLALLCAERPAAMIFALTSERRQRSLGCLTWGVESIDSAAIGTGSLQNRAVGLSSTRELEQSGGFLLVVGNDDGHGPSLSVVPSAAQR
jgi:pyruvate kinase